MRPAHRDALPGVVIAVDRGRYTCLVGDDAGGHRVVAMRARELHRTSIVVGDEVDIVGDTSGRRDTLARIVRIAPRRTVLRRSADDTDPTERVIVANSDALLIVVAAADPPPHPGFIDRCLVAAYAGRLRPLLLITKTDVADPGSLTDAYADLDLPVLASRRDAAARRLDRAGVTAVRTALGGRMTALVGHSGVGKSTLVNALVPTASRATAAVTRLGAGRHTSTSVVALPVPGGGWIIDTPGVRSFGLAHAGPDEVLAAFGDLAAAAAGCPRGCDHRRCGTGCALDDLAVGDAAAARRLASLRRLLAARPAARG